jgi:hypothetical protein
MDDDGKVEIELDLEQDLIDELHRIATRDGITVDEVVERALQAVIDDFDIAPNGLSD